jgi:UDP-N-acetylmuramoyl-L-alanyl-D-glutamate--2,6-diaminopimelate ligase
VKALSDLIAPLCGAVVVGEAATPVSGLAYDSRQLSRGDLFACLPGQRTDGHQFIPQAIAAGAAALLVQRGAYDPAGASVPTVVAPDTRAALAAIADAFYDHPSRDLRVIGVTGTNGKTTTSYLIEAILRAQGRRTGVIGTLAYRIGDETRAASHTTPEAPDLQALLAEMLQAGVQDVCMEVSSHALSQHRADYCRFGCAVFTNLSRDHLDYHASLQDYFEAKARLFWDAPFQPASGMRANVINADDEAGARLVSRAVGATITYGMRSGDVTARAVEVLPGGTRFTLQTPLGVWPVNLKLIGAFNVYNALAALAAAVALGLDAQAAIGAVEAMEPVAGRFERVEAGQQFEVVVDYSHTPDGLEKALENARRLTRGRLIVVFGCGGDRDTGKRPLMGELAARLADVCVVTSDNPRSEDPDAIIAQILAGVGRFGRRRCRIEPDRREAIRLALDEARAGDLVLIAGKGHETYQIFRDHTIPFDDRQVAAELIAERAKSDA